MKRLLPAAFLLLPLLSQAEPADKAVSAPGGHPAWFTPTLGKEKEVLQRLQRGRQEVENVIATLGKEFLTPGPAKADDSLPPTRKGYAVAVADGGLLFDSDNSRFTYIGNVRVNEERMQLRCINRLYIQLPPESIKKKQEDVIKHVEATEAPPAKPRPGQTPPAKPAAAPAGGSPIKVFAYDAMLNGVENNILLRSEGPQGQPSLDYNGKELRLAPAKGDSTVLADYAGNIHIRSGQATLHWRDDQGRQGTLIARNGHIVFNREHHTLYIDGPAHFTAPDGATLDCDRSLCATLQPEGDVSVPEGGGFLAQFTTLRYQGIEKAVAMGNVRASRPAQEGTPACTARGELCTYNGTTGECLLTGPSCHLAYGRQEIHTAGASGSLALKPNGDIHMQGASGINGIYELPARGETPARLGKFDTKGTITFVAAEGKVYLPAGIAARDAVNRFNCRGALVLTLKRTAETTLDRNRAGMLNLAIASYGEVASAHATGGVDMHYMDPAKNIPMDVRGHSAEFSFDKGTAHVEAAPGQKGVLRYGSYCLTTSSTKRNATMAVDDKGDIDVQGDLIHADLPYQDNVAHLDTVGVLHLTRDTRELQLGPGSHLEAPDGILTSNDKLYVTLALAPEDQAPAKSALARYPHLAYPFAGIESARTDKGGTLRTPKASMQCTGPIHVEMDSNTPAGQDEISRLRATAQGSVAVLGKDNKGRLVRATGDEIRVENGNKILTGAQVTLADETNTHIASGAGARITIDKNNNARITGAKQVTVATGLRKQVDKKDTQAQKD